MTSTISITQDDLMTALRGFLLTIVSGEVVQSQDNRVPMPQGDFCTMTPMFLGALSTDRSAYTDPGNNPGVESHSRSTQWTCQLDFYGPSAGDNASIVSTLVRTDTACDYFAASGIDLQPLYARDPKQTTLINAENQFENRWTMEFVGQFNPVVQSAQDFAASLHVGLAEVDVTFPPEHP